MDTIITWINGHMSIPWLICYFVGIILFAAIFYFAIKFAIEFNKITDFSTYSILKICLIAIAPAIYLILSALNLSPSTTLFLIISIIICIIVIIWNFFTLGFIAGLIFSILHISAGILCGISVAALIFALIIATVMIFVSGGSSSSTDNSGSSPSRVECLGDGKLYYVSTNASGQTILPERGNVIIRPTDYSGRYIDDYGNEYLIR